MRYTILLLEYIDVDGILECEGPLLRTYSSLIKYDFCAKFFYRNAGEVIFPRAGSWIEYSDIMYKYIACAIRSCLWNTSMSRAFLNGSVRYFITNSTFEIHCTKSTFHIFECLIIQNVTLNHALDRNRQLDFYSCYSLHGSSHCQIGYGHRALTCWVSSQVE